MQGFRFEQFAIAKGFITAEQLEEAKRIQKRVSDDGLEVTIEEVFGKKGWITPAQLAAIHALMGQGDKELIKGYEILCRLGQGGMGTVYKAKHLSLGTTVAIKILLPHFANEKDAVERFRREASILAQLNHTNIVRGIDAGFQNGVYYYVMEYVDGVPLSQKVNQNGKVLWAEAIGYMKQMAEALIYAAQMQMVHRDIKPDNILITKEGVAKLTDLGLAKMSLTRPHTTLTQTGWMVGTPAYMSPEQMSQGKDADVRSDLYSLGMTFFTVLTGTAAYQGDTTISIMQQRMTHDIPYKKLGQSGVPEGLVSVIRYMTVKDRAFRYQRPEDLLEDLKLAERNETPIHAKKLPQGRTTTQRITGKFPSMPPAPPSAATPPKVRSKVLFASVVAGAVILLFSLWVMQEISRTYQANEAADSSIVKPPLPKTIAEDEKLYRDAISFEQSHPSRIEELLVLLEQIKSKHPKGSMIAKVDEKILSTRERLAKAIEERHEKLRMLILKQLEERKPDEARRTVEGATSDFRCEEWKDLCNALKALIDSKPQ